MSGSDTILPRSPSRDNTTSPVSHVNRGDHTGFMFVWPGAGGQNVCQEILLRNNDPTAEVVSDMLHKMKRHETGCISLRNALRWVFYKEAVGFARIESSSHDIEAGHLIHVCIGEDFIPDGRLARLLRHPDQASRRIPFKQQYSNIDYGRDQVTGARVIALVYQLDKAKVVWWLITLALCWATIGTLVGFIDNSLTTGLSVAAVGFASMNFVIGTLTWRFH